MFGLTDLLILILSAFFILPTVIIFRELGYLIAGAVVGVSQPRITFGSGPRVFKWSIFDFRQHYHLYSWFSYDDMRSQSKKAYIFLYAAPILTNVSIGLLLNALLANDMLQTFENFWHQFLFYLFYYVLFDAVPMKTINGKPNNGRIIYEMWRYGKRTDYNKEPFIPSTSEAEKQYQEEMTQLKQEIDANKDN